MKNGIIDIYGISMLIDIFVWRNAEASASAFFMEKNSSSLKKIKKHIGNFQIPSFTTSINSMRKTINFSF